MERRFRQALSVLWLGMAPLAAGAQEAIVRSELPPAPRAAEALPNPALAPEAEASRDALRRATADLGAAERSAILGFYAARAYAPFWSEPGTGRLDALIAALSQSDRQGMPLKRDDLAALAGSDAAGETAPREVAASRAYLAFAGDLSAGVLDPSRVDPEINRTPVRPPMAARLARLETEGPAEALAALEPQTPEYRALVAEKARLESLLLADAWGGAVPEGPTLHPGEEAPRVAELRGRLGRMGYAAPASTEGAAAYDAALQQAVERFQSDHGLLDDGVAGLRTLQAINTGIDTRLEQVIVNLERLRWMNHDLGGRYIYVNIPDYSVALFDGGKSVYRTRSVVGKADDTRTPEFSDVLSYMVVNPTWHIPDSIAKRVYLPKLKRDPGVLAENNMRLLTRGGTEIDPALVDFTQLSADNFPFRIKQKPNEDNALGRVKFMFPNQFAIYLHDTPARSLFGKDARAFSNGCVRLQDPLELAYLLLEGQVEDPKVRFAAWLDAKTEKQVNLARPIPVHIVYRTVWAEADGTVRYRDDVYGRDAEVFHALTEAGATLPEAQG